MGARKNVMLGAVGAALAGSTMVVTSLRAASDDGPTFGRIPESAFREDGTVDASQSPDFVITYGRSDEPVGYVRNEDLLHVESESPHNGDVTAFDSARSPIVCFMIEQKRFEPLGQAPEEIESVTINTDGLVVYP